MTPQASVLSRLRSDYHKQLQQEVWFYDATKGTPSNADTHSTPSKVIAQGMLDVANEPQEAIPGQRSGRNFENATLDYLRQAFQYLQHLRPGPWIYNIGSGNKIASFHQYEHLATLQTFLNRLQHEEDQGDNADLRAAFARDYLIIPDIIIARQPIDDSTINQLAPLVNEQESATQTPLRSRNNSTNILHASISCKWTIRSDRSQNSRTDALNLIRNRKGSTPHIVVVTGEPLPTRIASIALGTGDIDCVYHMALYELSKAVDASENESEKEMLDTLVRGHRLCDISDLPFDLAI